MKKGFFYLILVLASLVLSACQETVQHGKTDFINKNFKYLKAADSTLVSKMSVMEKLRLIKVYKLAEYINLNLVDSVYSLNISEEKANELGIDKATYMETVLALEQVNDAIEEFKRHRGEGDTIELTDFKKEVKKTLKDHLQ